MKITAMAKSLPHNARLLKMHTAGEGGLLVRLTVGKSLNRCASMRAKAVFTPHARRHVVWIGQLSTFFMRSPYYAHAPCKMLFETL